MFSFILPISIALISGLSVIVFVINRIMGRLVDGWKKTVVSLSVFVGILVGFVAGASWLASRQAGWITLLPLILLLIGEGYFHWLRRSYQAEPPVEVQAPSSSLLRPVTTTDLQIKRYELGVADVPFEQLRVVLLSDLHINQTIPISYYQMVMDRVNQAQPDLILIAGDYVTERKYIRLIRGLLSGLRATIGVFGILGNHDYWANGDEVATEVRASGVTLLGDRVHRLDVGEGGVISLLGCERPWGGAECTADFEEDEFVLALAHSGDHIYKLASLGVRAVFSGHYHAGQFQIPRLGPIFVPSTYGRRFSHGHFLVDGSHLFVSAGVGAGSPPLRIYCPPDFFVVDFLKSG